jgi:hypothetical protein
MPAGQVLLQLAPEEPVRYIIARPPRPRLFPLGKLGRDSGI